MWRLRKLISTSSANEKIHNVAAIVAATTIFTTSALVEHMEAPVSHKNLQRYGEKDTTAIVCRSHTDDDSNDARSIDDSNDAMSNDDILSQYLIKGDTTLVSPIFYHLNSVIASMNQNHPNCCQCEQAPRQSKLVHLQRQSTIRKLNENSQPVRSLRAKYNVSWSRPIGEGAFSTVYTATNYSTNEKVAVKKISKRFTDSDAFQNEIDALLRLQENGGHPHICSLNESYEDGKNFYLVLDRINGGEMFDHLIKLGAYSEADAARLVREAADALCFIHGIGIVHGDLKPENLMLSTERSEDSSIKLVDFGCAYITSDDEKTETNRQNVEKKILGGNTPAYCPPEALVRTNTDPLTPSMDMWSLGIIIYIMLTGLHPFDLNGNCTDEEIEFRIKAKESPPLRNSPITAHLSSSAIDVIEKCMAWDASERISAQELLEHPWVRGDTAREDKMADASKKLRMYHPFQSKLEEKVLSDFFSWSDDKNNNVSKKTSLIERAFNSIDVNNRGFLTNDDMKRHCSRNIGKSKNNSVEENKQDNISGKAMSLSMFSNLLGENMKNRHFPRGTTIYREGNTGNHMYFINSGIIEVTTKDGSRAVRRQGDFFGEGALLHPKKIRSATIRCLTPVHAIEITREYFEKYVASSGLHADLKEKDKTRKKNRAKTILKLQKNLKTIAVDQGRIFFKEGEDADCLFILERGIVNTFVDGKKVFEVRPGDIFGEHSLIMSRPRNTTATCMSNECVVHEMKSRDFYELNNSSSTLRSSLRELCLRREFQKALVKKTGKEFPSVDDLREVFDAADINQSGYLSEDEVATLLTSFDPSLSQGELKEIVQALDLDETGKIFFNEFKLIFGIDEARASSI